MKKAGLLILLAVFAMTMTSIGCDNRSQLEKDADKAAKNIEGAFK